MQFSSITSTFSTKEAARRLDSWSHILVLVVGVIATARAVEAAANLPRRLLHPQSKNPLCYLSYYYCLLVVVLLLLLLVLLLYSWLQLRTYCSVVAVVVL
jgi:hypothetical protein